MKFDVGDIVRVDCEDAQLLGINVPARYNDQTGIVQHYEQLNDYHQSVHLVDEYMLRIEFADDWWYIPDAWCAVVISRSKKLYDMGDY